MYTSLALNSSGYPHISYYREGEPKGFLKYAAWDGSNWNIETVDNGRDSSLALDSSGYPHISYYNDVSGGSLKYAAWDGSTLEHRDG